MLPLGAEITVRDQVPLLIEPNPDDRPVVWEAPPEFPGGRARPMDDTELAQHEEDVAAAAAEAAKPVPLTLEQRFHEVVDLLVAAPDFNTARKQIAAALKDGG